VAEANRLRADLPADVQETLTRHEEAGTTDDPSYEEAVKVFYDRHLWWVPRPECVQPTRGQSVRASQAEVGAACGLTR
jgi:L-proline amide hydrolase